jgi:SAM-dependent methyltransferase
MDFFDATIYRAEVDLKKLRFIYAAIENFAAHRGRSFADLAILEVACGRGGITLPLATLGGRVTDFDINAERVEQLQTVARQRGINNLTLTVDNGYTFDGGQKYDVVIASEVFHHVLEPARLAASIRRSMTAGSLLVVTVPNGYGPWELRTRLDPLTYLLRSNWLRGRLGKRPYRLGDGSDRCQFFTRSRLHALFAEQSFRVVRAGNSDFIQSVLPGLRRIGVVARLDLAFADLLPSWAASGWYLALELTPVSPLPAH